MPLSDLRSLDDIAKSFTQAMRQAAEPKPLRSYHWMITYLVPIVGGFDFRQRSGVCTPDGRTREEMFKALAHRMADQDGLTAGEFTIAFFSLEPNDLDAA